MNKILLSLLLLSTLSIYSQSFEFGIPTSKTTLKGYIYLQSGDSVIRISSDTTINVLDPVSLWTTSAIKKYVLVHGGSGSGSTGWGLTGNTLTDSTTQFIGSTSNFPVVMKTNNTERLRITSNGRIGIGTTAPISSLDVLGEIIANGSQGHLIAKDGGNAQIAIGNKSGSYKLTVITTVGFSFYTPLNALARLNIGQLYIGAYNDASSYTIGLDGDADKNIGSRRLATNTAGFNLSISGNPAGTGSTDKGTTGLTLGDKQTTTGTGIGGIQFKRFSTSRVSSTTDNTAKTSYLQVSERPLKDNDTTILFTVSIPTIGTLGANIGYSVYAVNTGGDTIQVHTGHANLSVARTTAGTMKSSIIDETATDQADVRIPAGSSLTEAWTVKDGTTIFEIKANFNTDIHSSRLVRLSCDYTLTNVSGFGYTIIPKQ